MSGISGIGGAGGAGAAGIREIIALRQQIIDRSNLIQQVRTPQAGVEQAGEAPSGGDFAGTLKSAIDSVSQSQRKAEDLSEGWQKGEVTDVAKVMLARQEAGVAFEATLQVRNRLLSAYQDIMRMGV